MKKKILLLSLLCLTTAYAKSVKQTNEIKPASAYTQKFNQQLKQDLPFENKTDFELASKGFIGTIDEGIIYQSNKKTSYNIKQFEFLKGQAPDTANPSLWRQGQLNNFNGLFKVSDGIYQIRSFDISNMTLIKGKTGWIVVDPLLTPATAKAGMKLVEKHLGKFPVSAVIITHSHPDHYGGIRGVVDEADLISGKVVLYGPKDYYRNSINEIIIAGNTMARRASYMYGNLLPKNATGTLGSGLGPTSSVGLIGIIKETDTISSETGESRIIDGLKVEFIYTPEAEAPAELMFYLPELKAFCQAEEINHVFHNLYTLRGASVRNGLKWSQYIDRVIRNWGKDVEVSFGSHHWPTWGNAEINEFWKNQRDLYRFTHDQTMRLANKGMTPKEIAEVIKLPDSIGKQWYNRDYYGTLSHNIKAQYELYFGWFDGNPSHLNPLPPSQVGKKYIELAGGSKALLKKAKKAFKKGEYRWVAELLNHLVFAEPQNKAGKLLLADTYEQLGYIAESGPWRNFYLSAAKELRHGVKVLPTPTGLTPDMIKGLTTGLFFDYLAMKFIGTDEDAQKMDYRFNFTLPDVNEKIALLIDNGVVNPRFNYAVKENVTADIIVKRSDLNRLIMKKVKFVDLIKSGDMKIQGNKNAYLAFFSKLDNFDFWFNIAEP